MSLNRAEREAFGNPLASPVPARRLVGECFERHLIGERVGARSPREGQSFFLSAISADASYVSPIRCREKYSYSICRKYPLIET